MTANPKDDVKPGEEVKPQPFTEDYPNFGETEPLEPAVQPSQPNPDTLPDTVSPGRPVYDKKP